MLIGLSMGLRVRESKMIKNIFKKSYFLGLILLLFAVGFFYGKYYQQVQRTVVLRVSMEKAKVDYDLAAAMDYMRYIFHKNGYKVYETKYPGDFYFNEADDAKINVFVRGYKPFIDLRLKPSAFNVYFMHRFTDLYGVEFNGFDYFLYSQHNFMNYTEARGYALKGEYFAGGAVPHEILKPDYQYDVLYIYEYAAPEYEDIVYEYNNHKIYGGIAFAKLSKQEREQELARAKTVVYFSGFFNGDDENYIPYAVYDIISYGRPLVTNLRESLVQKFGDDVYLFDSADGFRNALNNALHEDDKKREEKALHARKKMFDNDEAELFGFIK